MATKDKLLRQAELLLKLARRAADPDLCASLVQRAADLKEIADDMDATGVGLRTSDVDE